jgi:hypothetical protein
MHAVLVLLSLICQNTFATETIAGWKATQGINEAQALKIAREAIHQDIGIDEDGQVCGVDEMWGWEREADLKADFPQERGEIFAITGYVKGPHSQAACSGNQTYDCRVVFNRPKKNAFWRAEYTDCEPIRRGTQD